MFRASTRSEELRQKYPVFRYESFEFDKASGGLTARFRFTAPPDISFVPEVVFEPVEADWNSVREETLSNAIFHLGLIELFSYWKATSSPTIEIHAGHLTLEQTEWWKDLLIHVMGEFFYCNDIYLTATDFDNIISKGSAAVPSAYTNELPARSLLTIGGGRDSALAAGLLRDSGQAFTCMMLNPSSAARRIAAQVTPSQPVIIKRSICPELLELNRRGFLNGHTPFSAYLAFLGAVSLLLYGYSSVIVANERSSDEGNVVYRGSNINHQYSKSFRFETRFDEYLQKYLMASGRYFSFVRPLYELQIGKLFSKFPEFFEIFKSCNRNRSESWCGRCPKCVSVFLTMYPFVSRPALSKIFGGDLFYRDETIPILRHLSGLEIKPFECVATTKEIIAALSLAVSRVRDSGEELPPALAYAVRHIPGVSMGNAASLLDSYGSDRMPAAFQSILKSALGPLPLGEGGAPREARAQ